MDSLFAIAIFVAFALPISLTFRPLGDALLVSPLVAFCLAIISATVAMVFDVKLMNAFCIVTLLITIGSLYFRKTRNLILANSNTRISHFDYVFMAILIMFAIGFLVKIPPPLAWDARSIWLFHASWMTQGATTFSQGQNLASLKFSHPGYPMGGPAAMGIVWQFSGSQENLWLGVRVIALLTLTNSILAVKILMHPFAGKVRTIGFLLLSLILISVVFLSIDGLALRGYMDVLLASLIGVACASLLSIAIMNRDAYVEQNGNQLLWIAGLAVFAAVSVKQEGVFFSLVLIIAFGLAYSRDRIRYGFLLCCAAASYLLWSLGISVSGGSKESDASGIVTNLPELLHKDSIAWSNFSVIWHEYFKNYWIFPNLLFVVAALVLLTNPDWKRYFRVLAFATIAWIGNWAVAFTPYMLGQTRTNLIWWLDTSFSRIVATQVISTIIFCGFVLANSFSSYSTLDTDGLATRKVT